jgi:hypothetical protein
MMGLPGSWSWARKALKPESIAVGLFRGHTFYAHYVHSVGRFQAHSLGREDLEAVMDE